MFRSSHPDIFTDQQEQWLGETLADVQEPSYNLLPERDSDELARIGQKILAQLPPTPIPYHFRVYETDDANGFSLAGGYVYISRKLITDAHSEDEVAGVIAHEIGHIYTHQVAVHVSRELKALLGVTSLTTREDVEEKFQLLVNAPWKEAAAESEDDAEKDELLADRVGMYALIKAGYAPRAFSENLDRVAGNKGHTGNFLTDILGGTGEISRRVRVTRKLAATLPSECGQRTPGSSQSFKDFQDAMREKPIDALVEPTPGLDRFKLDPPMHPPLLQVRFSPNGKFILAQDDSAIHVLNRSPLKYDFSIGARGARFAHFTPDSAHLVFGYVSMREEEWNLATGKRAKFHEMIDYDGCQQTELSPDGRTLVCLSKSDAGVRLKLIDVESGETFLDNKNFYKTYMFSSEAMIVRHGGDTRVATVLFSQDGKTMLILSGSKAMAYDLAGRSPIELGNDLSHLVDGRTAFVDSNKLVYECDLDFKSGSSRDTFKICESTFPAGLPINNFRIGYQWIEPVTNGAQVLFGPFKNAAAMLVDPSTGKASAGLKMDSVDVYGQAIATENGTGGVSLSELGAAQGESVDLPVEPLYGVEAAAYSSDGRFFAYSTKTRSAIWDLTAQKRVLLMRPFREAYFDAQNVMFAQYQPSSQQAGANYQIDLKSGKSVEGSKFAIDQFQHDDILVQFEALEKTGDVLENVNIHVADVATGKELWSRHYAHESPNVGQSQDEAALLSFDVSGDSGGDLMHHAGSKLVKTSDVRSEWAPQGLLVEIVDSHSGETRRVLQMPYRTDRGDDPRWATLFGNYLVVHGTQNTSGIYRVSDGVRVGGFFGRAIAGDASLGLIAVTNRSQEVTMVDVASGRPLKSVILDQMPRAARFVPSRKVLLVLSASQQMYSIPLPDRAPSQ